MDVPQTYCSLDLFMIYVSQIISLYILNLHSAICHLGLQQDWKKNKFFIFFNCKGKLKNNFKNSQILGEFGREWVHVYV